MRDGSHSGNGHKPQPKPPLFVGGSKVASREFRYISAQVCSDIEFLHTNMILTDPDVSTKLLKAAGVSLAMIIASGVMEQLSEEELDGFSESALLHVVRALMPTIIERARARATEEKHVYVN